MPARGSKGALIAFALIFSLSSGSNISLAPVCIARLCGTNKYSQYYSSIYSFTSIGSLIGAPITGKLIQTAGGQYRTLILFDTAAYIAALLYFILVRVMSTRLVFRVRF
jgi:MFS family permease